jgi:hypothetical protein
MLAAAGFGATVSTSPDIHGEVPVSDGLTGILPAKSSRDLRLTLPSPNGRLDSER